MATYHGAKCKQCRRHGMKLFLKGQRCSTDKCAFERRAYGPGEHGNTRRRRRATEYGVQLREKQKAKRIYGILERQFKNYYKEAERQTGMTGGNFSLLLGRGLDAVDKGWGFPRPGQGARGPLVKVNFKGKGGRVIIPRNRPRAPAG
ncbi:30S ribosomal protein S4, partial [bacterium]|nr:30S ribosomal protein S4 [bacterium]